MGHCFLLLLVSLFQNAFHFAQGSEEESGWPTGIQLLHLHQALVRQIYMPGRIYSEQLGKVVSAPFHNRQPVVQKGEVTCPGSILHLLTPCPMQILPQLPVQGSPGLGETLETHLSSVLFKGPLSPEPAGRIHG